MRCRYHNINGVVAAAHTEGGGDVTPNNKELVLRTLAGFAMHPNVGAVLLCDSGDEPVSNAVLLDWIKTHAAVRCAFDCICGTDVPSFRTDTISAACLTRYCHCRATSQPTYARAATWCAHGLTK